MGEQLKGPIPICKVTADQVRFAVKTILNLSEHVSPQAVMGLRKLVAHCRQAHTHGVDYEEYGGQANSRL